MILSLEIHCDLVQQESLVITMKEILGDRLITSRITGVPEDRLPSPEELRGKFLLKVSNSPPDWTEMRLIRVFFRQRI